MGQRITTEESLRTQIQKPAADGSSFNRQTGLSAAEIGTRAWRALLEEVYTTPKPGLVDRYSNGAHTDMDIHTFEKSAQALWPFFVMMAEQGMTLCSSDEELFLHIRKTGIAAETAMFRATDGVNTHKGLIFTLGIYCAAAGRCQQRYGEITESGIRGIQQNMTVRILTKELDRLRGKEAEDPTETRQISGEEETASHGEKNLRNYGTTGVRGEAIAGYPAVWEAALPVLRQGMEEENDYNLVKLQTLFTLMSQLEDSNILARKNPETLIRVQKTAEDFLKNGGAYVPDAYEKMIRMDEEFIRENISAGGCADILAAAIFIDMLLRK